MAGLHLQDHLQEEGVMFQYIREPRKILATAAIAVCLAVPSLAQADGGYLGADAVLRGTTLEYYFSGSESYTTQHLRLKAGYDFAQYYGVEMRLMNSGDDTYTDIYGTWKWSTGNVVSLYFKPHYNFGDFAMYGLVGLSFMDTAYEAVAGPYTGVKDTDTLTTFDFGFGGQYNFSPHFSLTGEVKLDVGSADYPTILGSTDVYGSAVAIGVVYRF
jgi:hypothetical protein